MAEAVASVLVSVVLEKLASNFIEKYFPVWGFKSNILNLKDRFDQIEDVLQDAEEKHIRENLVELWLRDLRSASMEIENVLDEILTEALLQRLQKKRGIKYKVRDFFSSDHNPLMFRLRSAHKVHDMRRKLDDIAYRTQVLGLNRAVISDLEVDIAGEMPNRETSELILDSSTIVGRKQDIEDVIHTICNKDIGNHDNGGIRVYGIWGMGGVGKTTLAQLVYNDEMINQYFELKCWVYVSQNFQVKEIIKGIIESIDRVECTLTQLDVLQDSLQNKLREKRFLIVLDDVWIEDAEKPKWTLLSETLSCGIEASIVVMTTRSHVTCGMMAKDGEWQRELKCLSENDSWDLFKKFAFAEGRERDDITELEPIGRDMVKKCEGLPLAIKTLGSLMWSKRSTHDWQRVKEANIWELEDKVFLALKVSYDNLLPYFRRCFAYCCLFPKGYDMEKDVVIQLWVVSGFIPPKEGIDLYVLGEEVFDCLVWRSLFQVVKDKKYSNNRYKMHDLMHDMAQHVMRDDCLLVEHGKDVIIPNKVVHFSSSCPDFQFQPQDLEKLTSLRSIFIFGDEYKFSITQIFNHTYLRVLYLCGIGLKTLPKSISKLKHLRYLNLSCSSIEVLPDSIIYLQNLQVLLLNFCYELYKLPENMRYMINLRRLGIESCHSLLQLPDGIKEKTYLRLLTRFHVGKKIRQTIAELGDLNGLEGELEISGLENVGDDEAKGAKLIDKSKLSVLKLSWSKIYKREGKQEMSTYEKVLEGLEPNSSLEKLSICFFMGKTISPTWMGKLNNLVDIGFSGCKRCEFIPPLGGLPKLRVIKLLGMDSLEGFHNDDMSENSNRFPFLQELNIFMCPNLISLPRNLWKLRILKLAECGALKSLPVEDQSFMLLYELEISGCKHLCQRYQEEKGVDWPKVSHIPKRRIDPPSETKDEEKIGESWLVNGVLSHAGSGTYVVQGSLKTPATPDIYIVKRKRDGTDRNTGCTDCKSSTCSEDCVCRHQCISCSKACGCSEMCTNKPFRKDKKIKIVLTKHYGWGVEVAECIKKEFLQQVSIEDVMQRFQKMKTRREQL